MKISKKKILEIIKEEVSDVNISNESGTDSEQAYLRLLSKKDPAGSRAALARLMKLDAKVQYLDQELRKLKNKNSVMNKKDVAGGVSPPLEETGVKGSMKISKKKLAQIVKEEATKALKLEQSALDAADAIRGEIDKNMPLEEVLVGMKNSFRTFNNRPFAGRARNKGYYDGWREAYIYCLDVLEKLHELALKGEAKRGGPEVRYEAVYYAAKLPRERFVDPTGGRIFQSTTGSDYGKDPVPHPAISMPYRVYDPTKNPEREDNDDRSSVTAPAQPGNGIQVAKEGNVAEVIRLMAQTIAICRDRRKNYERKSNRSPNMRKPEKDWPCRYGGSVIGISTSTAEYDDIYSRLAALRSISKRIVMLIDASKKAIKANQQQKSKIEKPADSTPAPGAPPANPLSLVDKSDLENLKENHMKISKKYLQEVIKEELQKIVAEKNGYGAVMFQQMIDNSPEAQAVKAKLENLDGVSRVYIDNVQNSKDPGFKLISVMLKVPEIQRPEIQR